MSSINSLSGGYKGGSKGSPAPQSTPQTRDKVLELLTPIKNYYIENDLMIVIYYLLLIILNV